MIKWKRIDRFKMKNWIVICFNDELSLNNDIEMLLIAPVYFNRFNFFNGGIVVCANDENTLNAKFSIDVTDDGIFICVNDEQSWKHNH